MSFFKRKSIAQLRAERAEVGRKYSQSAGGIAKKHRDATEREKIKGDIAKIKAANRSAKYGRAVQFAKGTGRVAVKSGKITGKVLGGVGNFLADLGEKANRPQKKTTHKKKGKRKSQSFDDLFGGF